MMPIYPTASAFPDQQPALNAGLTGASGITLLLAAVANSNAARLDIPVIGNSTVEGEGATAFTSRLVAQANRAIRLANGLSGGLGFVPIASTGESSFSWPVAQSGGGSWGTAPQGPVRSAQYMNSSGSFSMVMPAATTSVQIMFYDDGSSSQFSYQAGSGGVITETVSANTGDGALTSSITISGGETLTIAWVSGVVYMEGIVHYAGDESSGITLHGCGHYGWQAGQASDSNAWNQTGYGSGYAWQPSIAALNPSAIGIMLGVNDASTSVGNYTAAQFGTNLQALITGLRATSGLTTTPLLLIAEYQAQEAVTDAGGWAAYVAAIRSVAAANQNTHVIDLNYRLPSIASGAYGGVLYAGDEYHPSDLGHALIGEIIAAGVRIA